MYKVKIAKQHLMVGEKSFSYCALGSVIFALLSLNLLMLYRAMSQDDSEFIDFVIVFGMPSHFGLFSIIAIVLGHIARSDMNYTGRVGGKSLANVGLILGYIKLFFIIWVVVGLPITLYDVMDI